MSISLNTRPHYLCW